MDDLIIFGFWMGILIGLLLVMAVLEFVIKLFLKDPPTRIDELHARNHSLINIDIKDR